MQPQDNDFPLDKISSSSSGSTTSDQPAAIPADDSVTTPPPGGTTYAPQSMTASDDNLNPSAQNEPKATPAPITPPVGSATPVVEPASPFEQNSNTPVATNEHAPASTVIAPNWQQTAQNDTAQIYSADNNPSSGIDQPVANTPPPAIDQDFSQAANIATPSPQPNVAEPPIFEPNPPITPSSGQTPTPTPQPIEPGAGTTPITQTDNMAQPTVSAELPSGTSPNTLDLSSFGDQNQTITPPGAEAQPTPPSGLPGAEQLSAASAGFEQTPVQENLTDAEPMLADVNTMGSYGPPPSNKKKTLLIILGAVIGIILIIVLVAVFAKITAKKPAANLGQPTPATQTQQTQPTSGPATPPAGFVTIDKQCYSFAIYEKNTIPADQACSFANATYGKLGISKIGVTTGTESTNSLDDFVSKVKSTLTVTNDEAIKLDGMVAHKITYKASDAKTYVKVLALVTGKNYQQDGKKVTTVEITSSYGDDFEKQGTNTVIDTWRWK